MANHMRATLAVTHASWMDAAACATSTVEFFPEGGAAADYKAPRAICAVCPSIEACLEYAVVNDIDHGMWGGRTPTERRRIARERKAAADG